MSILLGPFDKGEHSAKEEDEELLVFGYSCKLYRDDVRAILEDSGQLLIPWMGDNSLMVDRYDIRNRLDDKSQFGLKPNFPHRITKEEEDFEDKLDKERYLALEWDEIRVEEQEEEEKKRSTEGSYAAVGFSYNNSQPPPPDKTDTEESGVLVCNPQPLEHPPTRSVDEGEDEYSVPIGLVLPDGMHTPATNKLHSIIEKTASFVSQQGTQMEIIIKAKQKFNPFFSFLDFRDSLHPYYRHLKGLITSGAYTIRQQSPDVVEHKEEASLVNGLGESANGVIKEEMNELKKDIESEVEKSVVPVKIVEANHEKESESGDSDSDESGSDDDEGGGYLHPLLMRAMNSKSRTPTPARENSPLPPSSANSSNGETGHHNKLTTSAFYTKSYSINSAPSLEPVADESISSQYHDTKQQFPHASSQVPPSGEHSYKSSYSEANTYYHNAQPHLYHQQQLQSHMTYPTQSYHYNQQPSNAPYDFQAYYQMMSANHIHQLQNGPAVPPSDLKSVVDKTAEYVAKNGDTFERTVLERHAGDSRFNFLNPWDTYHSYYTAMKQQCRERQALPGTKNSNINNVSVSSNKEEHVQTLDVSNSNERGVLSFKLKSKAPTPVMVDSNVNVFGVDDGDDDSHEEDEEGTNNRAVNEEQLLQESEAAEGEGDDDSLEEPPSKRKRTGNDKIGNKVQEFLSTVKAMFDEDDS